MGKSSAIAPRKKVSKRAATTNKRSTDVEDKHTTVNSPSPDGLPTNAVHPGSRKKWRKWLEENHVNSSQGVWLVRWKKCADQDDVTYDEAVEEALCFGWVDSKPRVLDELRTMLYFCKRKPNSGWAATNKARVEKLIASGLMTPSGLAAVNVAKENGTWNKLDTVESLEIPTDLKVALEKYPYSKEYFNAFPASIKKGILQWIVHAKKPETRNARIQETARLANDNIRANQWVPKSKR